VNETALKELEDLEVFSTPATLVDGELVVGFNRKKLAALPGLEEYNESEYVRKSVGNGLRDISRKHRELVKAELQRWDVSSKGIAQTHKLASKFL